MMPYRTTTNKGWWARFKDYMRTHVGITVIIAATLLLELTTGIIYYAAQDITQDTMERMVEHDMNSIYYQICSQLAKVEVTVNNMTWVVSRNLEEPDSMYSITRQYVEHNPSILGSAVVFVPNYYPQKGYWFEPYSIRRKDGTIEQMQLGSATHDYTKSEFFAAPIANNMGHWSVPYMDSDGAKAMVTTYSAPVHDSSGKTIAVVGADFSLDWLDGVMNEAELYHSTRRFLVTGDYKLLAGEDCYLFRSALEQIKADKDNEGYVILKDENGEKMHVFFHPIEEMTDWILVNVQDDNEVFGPLRHVRRLLLPLVLAGLLLLGFIIWRSSRNLERLRKVNAEKERIGSELRVASQIQQSMLPEHYMQQDNVEVCGSLVPAREVGGDLFDYFIRDEKLFFCIGDVSGKGVPSAMLMAVTHALFRSASAHESNPARIMHTINESACQRNGSNMFVTLFIGVLDLPTGHLRYCNAGHDAPYIVDKEHLSMIPCEAHLPVGVFEDVKYEMQEKQILPLTGSEEGVTLFLYTDGLTEAKSPERKQFGLERVEAVLRMSAEERPRRSLELVTEAVHGFVENAEQSDDLTMLAIRYKPKCFKSILTETLVLKNEVNEVVKLNTFMKSATEKMGIKKSLARQLCLAVEEAVVNVINYAYPAGTDGDITIRMMYDGKTLRSQIIDTGQPFDPTAKETADTTLSVEDRQIGGLGILLFRELTDSINYERTDGKNILTLIKKLNNIKETSQ